MKILKKFFVYTILCYAVTVAQYAYAYNTVPKLFKIVIYYTEAAEASYGGNLKNELHDRIAVIETILTNSGIDDIDIETVKLNNVK